MLNRILWNDKWLFKKEYGEEYKLEKIKDAESITLPHCYNSHDGQNGSEMFKGKCFYQKVFDITDDLMEDNIFLEIGAASLVSEVYINGKLVESTLLHKDRYKPLQGLRYIGTGGAETSVEPSTEPSTEPTTKPTPAPTTPSSETPAPTPAPTPEPTTVAPQE